MCLPVASATQRLIDSVWTVAFSFDGRTAKQLVLAPYRQFRYSAKQDDEGARVYDVANPQNVFSYGEAPEEPPEG